MAKTKTGLSKFEGKDVASVKAAIRNTGDGLSQSMSTDKVELHHGARVYVVLECLVDKVRFDPIKDSEQLDRVHMMKALDATIVDDELVADLMEAQVERNEQAQGVHKLPGMGAHGEGDDEGAGEAGEGADGT